MSIINLNFFGIPKNSTHAKKVSSHCSQDGRGLGLVINSERGRGKLAGSAYSPAYVNAPGPGAKA